MDFLGMNVQQARSHADQVRENAERLAESLAPLSAMISSLPQAWRGPDAENFTDNFISAVELPWNQVIDQLRVVAGELDQHADEQDAASDDSSGLPTTGNPGGAESSAAADRSGRQDRTPSGDVYASEEFMREWNSMTYAEREKVATEMVRDHLAQYDVDPGFTRFADLDDGSAGAWYEWNDFYETSDHRRSEWKFRGMELDRSLLDDPHELLATIGHEARHAIQFEMIDRTHVSGWDEFWGNTDRSEEYHEIEREYGITRSEVEQWRENDQNYIDPDVDPEGYETQPVEVDAEQAGQSYVGDMTVEDLRRYQKEAGVR